ncbi:hypothetical protein PtA15_6A154 [Puccinia triticina]|uniref:Uncharacterized protein n=1 Tax=Puccinia triticina TaxID=208348 RepID=A0ABY7CN19_9BASI|nr:uncharacterized protein PtA15_6A154 [Puccinia triticina]WAQ85526.1 hypothetical protein PtA15_6A154 [Puccinia triticina]WAR55408.1 hypothetical protein PtB15_6B149 [Puccinia triticina]
MALKLYLLAMFLAAYLLTLASATMTPGRCPNCSLVTQPKTASVVCAESGRCEHGVSKDCPGSRNHHFHACSCLWTSEGFTGPCEYNHDDLPCPWQGDLYHPPSDAESDGTPPASPAASEADRAYSFAYSRAPSDSDSE